MIKLFGTKIELNFPASSMRTLLTYLSEDDQAGVLYFYRSEDRLRCLFGKLLLRHLFRKEFHSREWPPLFYDRNKRPYQKLVPQLDFNLSHSGEWVICGMSDSGKIGVDVERICLQPQTGIADRYFSREEADALRRLPPSEKAPAFCHLWTLKEAYIKAEGSTFRIPLNAFRFDISNFEHPACKFSSAFKYPTHCIFRSLKIGSEYIVSVCAFKSLNAEYVIPDIIEISMPELLGVLKA